MKSTLKNTSTKLAYLTGVLPALSETFIYREILELERRGYALHLFSLRRPDRATLSAEALPLCEQTHYLLPARIAEVLAAHAYYACHRPLRYPHSIWQMVSPFHHHFKDRIRSFLHFGEGAVLARQMQEKGITHVHSHYASHPASVARAVYLLTGIPYSISAHADDVWHDRLLVREKLAEAQFVACCSAFGRSELIKQGQPSDASNVHVVYHGIDTRWFVPPGNGVRQKNLILGVGRLDPAKGFADLVSACAELERQGIDFRCEIVGTGAEKDRLATLIRQHALVEKVILTGAVSQEKLLSYYHRAAIFALPCVKIRGTLFDGLPNVLVEAMACGLPTVSTYLSAIPELINNGKDGFLVISGNPLELADRLKQLLQNDSLRQNIGEAARKKICIQFDNRETIEPLIKLLQCCAGL